MIQLPSPPAASTFKDRLARLQVWARDNAVDAVVVFGHGSALGTATRSHGNLRYLLDWDADAAFSAAIIAREGVPRMVVSNIFATLRGRESALMGEVQFAKGPAFAEAMLRWLPQGGRIAIAGKGEIPLAVWSVLASAGASNWIDCDGVIADARKIKDAGQLALHRQAAAACDRIFEQLPIALASGKPGFAIQADLENFGRQLGCDHCKTWLTVMPQADYCHYIASENQKTPAQGDQVLLGLMLTVQGHWGHAIRTGTLGAPSAGALETYSIVRGMFDAMLHELRPGADLRAVGQLGLADPGDARPIFQFRSGHALGHSYEEPVGSAEFPQPYDAGAAVASPHVAEPGMLFELHPSIFIKGVGGASIGDMVLITEHGSEILTTSNRDLLRF